MEPQMEIDGSIDPEPSQPRMFGGYVGSARLPWGWATERLSRARTYWIATTRPTGQPHSRPVWGVWLDNTFYFSTGSLAAQNLASQPAITVHLERGDEVVILEGVTHEVSDVSLLEQVVSLYNQKYHWDLDRSMPFVPRSLSAGILRSQNSIRSPPLWETQPAGAFGDRRRIPPLKQFQGYLTSTSVRTTRQRFARLKFLTSTHTSGVQGAKPPCMSSQPRDRCCFRTS